MHTRTIGVEDTSNFDTQLVLPPIVEKERLGATFAFIVTGTRPNHIYIAPVLFRLRVNMRVSVHLRSRRLKNLGLEPLSQAKHIYRTMHARLRCLYRVVLIVDRRRWTSQIVDLVDLQIERKRYVV